MRRLGIVFLPVLMLLAAVQTARAAVDLLYFLPAPAKDNILLTWETAQEIDNAGFYIQRSDSQGGTFARISGFIASLDPFVGHYYEYKDSTPAIGVTYYYKLEAVDSGGNSVFYGPVAAMVTAATLTPTVTSTGQLPATITATPTTTPSPTPPPASTPTKTSTGVSATTATATTRPASTSIPQPTASLPVANVTSSPTVTAVPTRLFTPTLEPLPEINLVFPAPTSAPTFTRTPVPTVFAADTRSNAPAEFGTPPRLVLLALVVLVLWLALVGFVVFFSRHTGR